jgi:hypothetical protein
LRRLWASFASQTYLTLACYHYGEWAQDERALQLANRCARKLIGLQGPMGEWPWFYDVMNGRVLDYYEVYSVHQDGMAPAFLEHAEKHGVVEAHDALRKGALWIFGNNQLGLSMLVPHLGMIIRSHVRHGELNSRNKRAMRAIAATFFSNPASFIAPDQLILRRECRSYHLGWVLWAFSQRDDLPEITHHPQLKV